MHALLAQALEPARNSIWPAIIQAIDNNGFWIFVGVCVLAGTAKHLVGQVLRHNERISMIQAGINPDESPQVYRGDFDEQKRG